MTGPTFEGLGRGRGKWMSGMVSFVYHCPANGQKAQPGSPTIRLIWTTIMNDSEYLALQASIICVLFFILGNAAIIEHPEWFR